MDVMKIGAVPYELTETGLGKDGPSGREPSSGFECASECIGEVVDPKWGNL